MTTGEVQYLFKVQTTGVTEEGLRCCATSVAVEVNHDPGEYGGLAAVDAF